MRIQKLIVAAFAVAIASSGSLAVAAFIVEPHTSGKANANFTYEDGSAPSFSTSQSSAAGLSATHSAFGGNGANVDRYIFSYTPGNDVDNTVYTPGQVLGDTRIDPPGNPSGVSAQAQLASGLVGGVSGTYNVYMTWPGSGNVNSLGSVVTLTSDGSPIVLDPVDQNSTTTNGPTPSGVGGANKWLLIGTVDLTTGNTYTVTQEAHGLDFVSQRSSGVMWELQIPEPASVLLAGLGLLGIGLMRRRQR